MTIPARSTCGVNREVVIVMASLIGFALMGINFRGGRFEAGAEVSLVHCPPAETKSVAVPLTTPPTPTTPPPVQVVTVVEKPQKPRPAPLPSKRIVPVLQCNKDFPPGESRCEHATPSIELGIHHATDEIKPFKDICSWWGDMGPHGTIPKKRLTTIGTVPPRSMCWSDRVCINNKRLCLGHKNNPDANPLQFCPHHDGPFRISLKTCPADVACQKQHELTCGNDGVGSGRTIMMVHHRWVVDGNNIWHWLNTLLDIFGSIVHADPQLVQNGTFSATNARLTLILQLMGYQNNRDLSQAGDKSQWAAGWGESKGAEVRRVLESFTNCPLDLPKVTEPQCYGNVVMGTPTNVFLQWEDKMVDEYHIELATAFAKHLLGHFTAEKTPQVASPVAAPWDKIYEADRQKPKMLLIMRGEGSKQGTRQMVGIENLITAAGSHGFQVMKSDANDRTTLMAQAMLAGSADVVCGVHGAGLAWSILLPAHGILVELRPGHHLVDRTFIYPGIAASRDLTYIEWHQSEPVTPSKDRRLALNSPFNITQASASYHVSLIMRKLAKNAPWFRKPAGWHSP